MSSTVMKLNCKDIVKEYLKKSNATEKWNVCLLYRQVLAVRLFRIDPMRRMFS